MIQAIRRLLCGLVTLAAALSASPTAAEVPSGSQHLRMRLVAEGAAAPAGGPVTLALETRPEPGWHGYWGENPGDAGFPPKSTWTLPQGVRVGPWRWPLPETLLIAGLMNYVYDRPFAPLSDVTVPAGLAVGTRLPIRLHLDYLVCTDKICVPEQQDVATVLTVGPPGPRNARFDAWRAALPRSLVFNYADDRGDPAHAGDNPYQVAGNTVRLSFPLPADAALRDPHFFPMSPGIDNAAPQRFSRDGDRLVITTNGHPQGNIEGVLRIGPGMGLQAAFLPGTVAAPDGSGWGMAALVAFAGAVLGGLILNVMPCVFPILSLKALSLARGGVGEVEARNEALAYTAGVVLVCLALGGAILALRAGGTAVGWAFQLQHPATIAALLLLSVAITLNLLGAFEVPTPRFVGERAGQGGAFATGALAAFIATPCTGPFMGAALGAALVLPWPAALAVFGGLGLGLALPFVLIGYVPALRRRLPRPGAWMGTFRRLLAVPMALTALALGWVLWRIAGSGSLVEALAAGAVLALALVKGGRRQGKGRAFGPLPLAAVAVATLAAIVLVPHAQVAGAAPAGGERFSEVRLAALRAQGRPVFAYFTADWCLTCKVNEKTAIETSRARAAFARNKVAVLVGDWTDGDPALGRFIEAHNRAGVPLYLFYPVHGEARILPQVLTPGLLEELK